MNAHETTSGNTPLFLLIGYFAALVIGTYIPNKYHSLILGFFVAFLIVAILIALASAAIERNEGIKDNLYESEIRSVQGDLSGEINVTKEDIQAAEEVMQGEQTDLEEVTSNRMRQIQKQAAMREKGQFFEVKSN